MSKLSNVLNATQWDLMLFGCVFRRIRRKTRPKFGKFGEKHDPNAENSAKNMEKVVDDFRRVFRRIRRKTSTKFRRICRITRPKFGEFGEKHQKIYLPNFAHVFR